MENLINTFTLSENLQDKIIHLAETGKENLRLKVICASLAKSGIDEIILKNVEELSNIDLDDIESMLPIMEHLMKLSFDLWRDYDYFQSFSFKGKYFSDFYERGLKQLHYQLIDDRWVATSKIELDLVVKNIWNYLICYSIWKEKKKLISLECTICDNALSQSSICLYCGTSIDEMIAEPTNHHNHNNFEEIWICKNCSHHNYFKDDLCNVCKIKGPHHKKWLCEKCHLINHPFNVNCHACDSKNIYLINCIYCRKLKFNYKLESLCSSCEIKFNGNWECKDSGTHKIYGPKHMSCRTCKTCPLDVPKINETTFNQDIEMWKCTFCREETEIDQDQCNHCDNFRYRDGRTLCNFCGTVNACPRHCRRCKKKLVNELNNFKCLIS